MNIRLRGFLGLSLNYAMLIVFGLLFAAGINYFWNGIVNTTSLIVTMLIINTITMKHMRSYWVDLVLGERTTYLTSKPGFTDEILDKPKAKPEKYSDLKGSLLDE